MTGAFRTRRIVPPAARKSPLSHFGSEFEIMKIPGHTKSRMAFDGGALLLPRHAFCHRVRVPIRAHSETDVRFGTYCSNRWFAEAAQPGDWTLLGVEEPASSNCSKSCLAFPTVLDRRNAPTLMCE
jgi:hypothetical protein